MKIGFVSRGTLLSFQGNGKGEGSDLLLFGLDGMGEVRYEKELKGETEFFESVALLSRREQNIVVCGCITDTRGHRRRSAVVAERGKLLGISDMLHVVDGGFGCGAELRIYETKMGKMGVVVGEDVRFFEDTRALAVCGCDFIVCPYGKVEGEIPFAMLRADCYRLGIPIFLCGRGYAMIGDPKGEIAFSSPHSPAFADYTPTKEYHLIERRKRGYFPEEG